MNMALFEFTSTMGRWSAAFIFLICTSAVVSADSVYPGAVPCQSNSSIVGYTNLTALNTDIFMHYSGSGGNGVPAEKYDYILCPDTTFIVGNGESIVPATDESAFSCGHRHTTDGNCILLGGSFQVYFLDFLALQNIIFRGITFVGANTASVYGDAHPTSLVYFVDCIFKNHVGISTIYIFFTPYDPGRRLDSEDKYEADRPAIAYEYEAITENKEHRDLQVDIRYSMGILFRSCHFKDNSADDAIVLNIGGEVALINTKFHKNDAQKLGIFSTLNNGHAYLASGSYFSNNTARLGPVFIDQASFLQYSEDANGLDNTGKTCNTILFEDDGANCAVPALDAICTGDCCAFEDESCDLHNSETTSPTASATMMLTDYPTPSPAGATPSVSTPTGSKPSDTRPTNTRPADNMSPTNNDIQMDGLIETKDDVPAESGVCSGYCIAFSLVLTFYVVLVAVLVAMGIRRRKIRKETMQETSLAQEAEGGSDRLDDRSIS